MIEWLLNRWASGGLRSVAVRTESLTIPDARIVTMDATGMVISHRRKFFAIPWTEVHHLEIADD